MERKDKNGLHITERASRNYLQGYLPPQLSVWILPYTVPWPQQHFCPLTSSCLYSLPNARFYDFIYIKSVHLLHMEAERGQIFVSMVYFSALVRRTLLGTVWMLNIYELSKWIRNIKAVPTVWDGKQNPAFAHRHMYLWVEGWFVLIH